MVVTKNYDLLKFPIEIIPIIPYIGVVFSFMGSPSYLFPEDFIGNANICVAIKSSSMVCCYYYHVIIIIMLLCL